jgi:hypothetical protein
MLLVILKRTDMTGDPYVKTQVIYECDVLSLCMRSYRLASKLSSSSSLEE